MFQMNVDPKEIINDLGGFDKKVPLTQPSDPKDFPHVDEVPEGCIVLKGVRDHWGYKVDLKTDVVYANRDGRDLHLQILLPVMNNCPEEVKNAKHAWPCIVYVQGSAFHEQWVWNNLDRHIRLAQKGYAIAIVEYRPSEVAPFPAQMQDAKTAIRFMRKNASVYDIDPDRIAVAGDSSGGHTALMAGFTGNDEPDTDLYSEYSAEVKCIVDVYGPTVFALMNYYPSSQNHYDPDSPEGFEIGRKDVLENPELANATIPMNYLSKDKPTPPLLTIHGGRDMLVPFNQSCQLYKVMKEMGKDVTFYKLDDANRGMLGFDSDTVLNIVAEFLRKNL